MVYFRIACIVLLVVSASHLVGHYFIYPQYRVAGNSGQTPPSADESTMFRLMHDYHRNIGGSSLTFLDVLDGLSLCYALFLFWLGIVNIMMAKGLTRNRRMLSQICLINAAMLLMGVIISYIYFFWLPLVALLTALLLFVVAAFNLEKDF